MSYNKQTWKSGDIVSSEKLNHIEDGIANQKSDIMFVHVTIDPENILFFDEETRITTYGLTVEESYEDILQAMQEGKIIFCSPYMVPLKSFDPITQTLNFEKVISDLATAHSIDYPVCNYIQISICSDPLGNGARNVIIYENAPLH